MWFTASLGFGNVTQGQTETCPEATPLLPSLCASGHCLAKK